MKVAKTGDHKGPHFKTNKKKKLYLYIVTDVRINYWGDHFTIYQFSLVQSLSHVQLFVTSWTAACQTSLSITNSQSLFKLMSTKSVMPSNHLILCFPLLLLPSVFPRIRVFSNESVLHNKWRKCWSFSFTISPSNEYSRLISFRMDWLDLLAVQSRVFSNTTVQKHQFFSPQSSYKRVSEWIKLSH